MKRPGTGGNRGATGIPPIVRALAVALALLLVSCSVMKMNVTLDLRSSTLAFDSNSAYPGYDVVWLNYSGRGTSSQTATAYGAPDVPEWGFQVVLPQWVRVKSVAGVATDAESIPGSFRLMPHQRPMRMPRIMKTLPYEKTAPPEFVPPLAEIYDSVKPYPPQLYAYVCQGRPYDFNVASIVAYPVQYIPREGKLTFYRRYRFVLTLVPDRSGFDPNPVQPSEVVRKNLEESVRSLVINPEDVTRFAPWGSSTGQ